MTFDEADWTLIPLSQHADFRQYIEHGIIPQNEFLCNYLQGNLRQASLLAGENEAASFYDYAKFLNEFCPVNCWGSPKLVLEYNSNGGLRLARMQHQRGQHEVRLVASRE